ncbi:DsrE family protein [Bordetella petrii]|uniref:DsrE family protein n=1 Tax=Bordetella petrii TaxID=94624 RepID=UPI00372FB55C
MTTRLLKGMCALLLLTATAIAAAGDKVVYHINDAKGQALSALRNIRNHLDTAPDTTIAVVSHAEGVDFLMNDYPQADQVAPLVSALASRGVKFDVCEITLKNRKLSKDQFMLEAEFVPSGVVELAKLQQQGYAYIKP